MYYGVGVIEEENLRHLIMSAISELGEIIRYDDDYNSGVVLFDRMSQKEQMIALFIMAKALLTKEVSIKHPTLYHDATLDVILRTISQDVILEIEDFGGKSTDTRKLARQAYIAYMENGKKEESDEELINSYNEDIGNAPKITSKDVKKWEEITYYHWTEILQEDTDFLIGALHNCIPQEELEINFCAEIVPQLLINKNLLIKIQEADIDMKFTEAMVLETLCLSLWAMHKKLFPQDWEEPKRKTKNG